MPLYDYDCSACGRRFEVVHGVYAEGPTACPICGKGPIRKTISAAAVHYKGSGWAKKERHAMARGSSRSSAEANRSDGGTKGEESSSSSGSGPATATKPVGADSASTADAADSAGKTDSASKSRAASKAD